MKRLITLIVLLLAVGVAQSDTLYKGKIGDPDVHWWNGATDNTTYNRRTSTGRLAAITDVGADDDYDIHFRFGDVITRKPWADVRAFGADGTDTTEDSTAILAAIASLPTSGGTVFIPAGTYYAAENILLSEKSNITIIGEGYNATTLKVLGGTADTVTTLIVLKGCTACRVMYLKLDGNATNLTQASAHNLMYLGGSSHCEVGWVYFTDCGNGTGTAGGSHFKLVAYEVGDGDAGDNDKAGNNAQYNYIHNCYFDDSGYICKFGVRALSNHDSANATLSVAMQYNRFENNTFVGYTWNAFAHEGPASMYDVVKGNLFRDFAGYDAIDCEKGASYNVYTANIITNMKENVGGNSQTNGFRLAGTSGATHMRYATGNIFTGNIIKDLGDADSNSRGIYVYKAYDNTISDNVIDVQIDAGNSHGIEIKDRVSGLHIRGNTILNVTGGGGNGIFNDADDVDEDMANWHITNNLIETAGDGIIFANTDAGAHAFNYVEISDNTIYGALDDIGISTGTDVDDVIIKNNTIIDTTVTTGDGIRVNGDRNQIIGNVIKSIGDEGIKLGTNATEVLISGNWVDLAAGATGSLNEGNTVTENMWGVNWFETSAGADTWYSWPVRYSGKAITKTANYQVTLADDGKTFDNTGDTGDITFTLPDVAPEGYTVCFMVAAAQNFYVDPQNNDKFIHAGCGNGDRILSATVGDTVCIFSNETYDWNIKSMYPAATDWTDAN